MTQKAVVVSGLSKSYKQGKNSVVALQAIDFRVNKGELFGVIGPDGAGKTTLFRILTTLMLPDTGTATVIGFDTVNQYADIRSQVGYMPGRFSLYQDLTVEENMNFFATIFNTSIQENYDLVKDIYSQLEPFKHRKAGQLSGGMKQKLALSCALIHKPEILFLDEPTTGVDAVSRKEFWEMLKRLKAGGITILVSTPYMDEATMCDRIALIQGGRIMQIDTPQAIVNSFGKQLFAIRATNMYALLQQVRMHPAIADCYPCGAEHHVLMNEGFANKTPADFFADTEGFACRVVAPDIEDCFIALMKAHTA